MSEFINNILIPSNLIIFFSITGIILFIISTRKRAAVLMFALSLSIYIVSGTGIISFWILGTLEHRYKPLASTEGLQDFKTIVILTGYAEKHEGIPISSEVNFASAYRMIEGLRITRLLPEAKVLISGKNDGPWIMKELLQSLGLHEQRMIIDNQSRNTHESAVNVANIIDETNIILVTSAAHMPRAVGVFRKAGMNPIPAPTNYMSIKKRRLKHYLPSPEHILYADMAVHEYLGIAWYQLTGRM